MSAEAMSAEQAADFAALQAQAGQGAGAAPGAAEQDPDAIAPPSAGSLQVSAMVLGMVRPILGFVVPSLKTAPEELWEPLPVGIAGVLDHYGGASAEWLRNPWARLAFCMAPLAGYVAMQELSAEKKPAPALAAPGAGPEFAAPAPTEAPGQKTVTIGAALPADA